MSVVFTPSTNLVLSPMEVRGRIGDGVGRGIPTDSFVPLRRFFAPRDPNVGVIGIRLILKAIGRFRFSRPEYATRPRRLGEVAALVVHLLQREDDLTLNLLQLTRCYWDELQHVAWLIIVVVVKVLDGEYKVVLRPNTAAVEAAGKAFTVSGFGM